MSAVAEIGVRVVADATKLQAGLQKALDSIDAFGNKVQRAANKLAAVGAAMTAVGAKMISDAAKYDTNVKAAVDRLGNAYSNLAVRLGTALIPALNAITAFVGRLVSAWDSLAPSTRRTIADVALLAAKILIFVGVAGAVVGIIGDLAGLAAVLLPVLVPVLAIAAGLAGIALLLGAGYGAWKEYGGAISEAAKTGFDAATDFAKNYFTFMTDNLRSLANFWIDLAKTIVDANKAIIAHTPGGMLLGVKNPIAEAAGLGLDALSAKVNGPNGIGAAISSAGNVLVDAAVSVGEASGDGIKSSLRNFAELTGLDTLIDKLDKLSKPGGALPKLKPIYEAKGNDDFLAELRAARRAYQNDPTNRVRSGASQPVLMKGLDKIQALDKHASRFADQFAEVMKGAGATISDAVMTAAPKFAGMIQGAVAGMKAGGPWGAFLGAVASLLTKTQSFTAIMGQVEAGIGGLVDALEPTLKPILALNVVANGLLQVVTQVLKPVLETIGRVLFDVFKWFGLGIMDIVIFLKDVWNGMILGLRNILYAVGDLFKDVLPPLRDAFYLAAASVGKMTASTTKLSEARNDLATKTWDNILSAVDNTEATADNTSATEAATRTVTDFAESLTNVPQGFKVAAARFRAMSVGSGAAYATGGNDARGGTTVVVQAENVYGYADLIAMIQQGQRSATFRATGSRAP